MPITLSYPKPRDVLSKFCRIARTDSASEKMVLPKGAIVVGVEVTQTAAAVTAAGAFNLGWSGAATALVNAFSLPTSTVGQAQVGAAAGSQLIAGTALDSDKTVIASYTVGTSTAGGTAIVRVDYFMPGPGELVDS